MSKTESSTAIADASVPDAVVVSNAGRRALFGLGTIAAASALTGAGLATGAAPASAASAVRTQPLPTKAVAKKTRDVAFEPFADGGPETRDVSMASAYEKNVSTTATRVGKQYSKASAAAKAAGASSSKLFPGSNARAHLLRRATFGSRPRDLADLKKYGVDKWLARQLSPSTITDTHGIAAWKLFPLAGASPAKVLKSVERYSWDAVYETAQASLARQVFSQRQLYEIVVDIFANHLHVPLPGEQWHTAPDYLVKVIRANALGSFSTMLLAAMKHPAMLNFLNNDESRKSNVNENLGRELLELHTVGIAGKYTEDDVRASASILSGRTWDYDTGVYEYNASEHVTGPVKVLGFSHSNATGSGGEAVGDAYLKYLAKHPSTARAIARKIAVRFVSDTPSDDLVNRLAAVYLKHNTSIRKTVEAVFLSSDFWMSVGVRMRRPLEDAVGTLRVLDVRLKSSGSKEPLSWLYWELNEAGHTPHGWAPPNGYPDVAAAWLGAGAMIQRWNMHRTFVYGWWNGLSYVKPMALAKKTTTTTALAWTTKVADRLFTMKPSRAHLEAAIRGAGLTPGGLAPTYDWQAGKIVALLLDSPYFQLR